MTCGNLYEIYIKTVKEMEENKMKWKLFCTITMQNYVIEASSEYEAKKILATRLNVPLYCIDVYR